MKLEICQTVYNLDFGTKDAGRSLNRVVVVQGSPPFSPGLYLQERINWNTTGNAATGSWENSGDSCSTDERFLGPDSVVFRGDVLICCVP